MDSNLIVTGLIFYLELVVLLTFHEYAHAWMVTKCGDNTARLQGRLSLNPIVHIELIGTLLVPLIMIFASPTVGRFLIGWAKPVPFNPDNLNHRWRDEMLIAMAGPVMNVILAVVLVGFARVAVVFDSAATLELFMQMAQLSLLLCFFNLIPIPPLDGSHVLRNVTGMTYETYFNLSRFGFIAIVLLLQVSQVRNLLNNAVGLSMGIIARCFGLPL